MIYSLRSTKRTRPHSSICLFLRLNYHNVKLAVNTRLLLSHRMEGIPRFIHETVSRMVKAHPEIEFHFLFDRPYDPEFIYADNVRAKVLFPQSRHPILWYWWFELSVKRYLDKHKIDVFYSADMYLSLRSKVPSLYVSHDLNYIHFPRGLRKIDYWYLNYFFPKYHKRADHIIAVSEFTKSDIIKQFHIDPDKISVAYNDVPAGFRKFSDHEIKQARIKYAENKPYFFYVGSLHPRKNVSRLLQAFDKFKSDYGTSHKLLIYGRRAFKTGDIFHVYKNMNHSSSVQFLDNSYGSVQKVLPGADALCYVSLFEGFGIPILEAFHSGVPVISSMASSMPEVAGDAALLIDPVNIDAIASAMFEVLKKDTRHKLLVRAENQMKRFSWERSADIIWHQIKQLHERN